MNIFGAALLLCPNIWGVNLASTSSGLKSSGEIKLFGTPASYNVDSTVLLNDADRKDKEVGYKIKAVLKVDNVWSEGDSEFLLKFELLSPELHLRGKHVTAEFLPYPSIWDSHKASVFYAHWKRGLILTAYLNPNDPLDILNYKKSILSLFQFQVIDGENKETDVSGACEILYETLSMHIVRKIKKRCSWEGEEGDSGDKVTSRRVTRYELTTALDTVASMLAEEVHELREVGVALKGRAWHRLNLRPPRPEPRTAVPPRSLDAALADIPKDLLPLPLILSDAGDDPYDDMEFEEALALGRAALEGEEAGEGGEIKAANALLALLPALRAASAAKLRSLLQRDDYQHLLPGLCRALGLAATSAAHEVARDVLQLRARDPSQPLAHVYLAAVGLSERPAAPVVRDLLTLGEEGRCTAVAASALLASAAAARVLGDPLALSVRDTIAKGLARCKDEDCFVTRLTALGNLRREDTVDLLLQHAEKGSRAVGVAALEALAATPPSAIISSRFARLVTLALAIHRSRPLEVRAAAVDLVTRYCEAVPLECVRLAVGLTERGPHELRRLFWQRMHARARVDPQVRYVFKLLPARIKTWDAQAHAGTSSVLERGTGWSVGGWRARLQSVQLAAGGLLRRGLVRLEAVAPDNSTHEALSVELWTRGLEAFASGGSEEEVPGDTESVDAADEEGAAGGLALAVGGARMRGLLLFDGQAELLGHIWSGAGSEPTPALRALQPLPTRAVRLPLAAGVALRMRWRGALAYALDAQAQVSLWSRTARARLDLRAAGLAAAEARLRTAWGTVRAHATAEAAPRLSIGADLDFYDRVALCVRVRLAEHERARNVTLDSELGSRRLRVTRRRRSARPAPGHTLALGALNDAACRTLGSVDDDF